MKVYKKPELQLLELMTDEALAAVEYSVPTVADGDTDDDLTVGG